MPSLLFPPRSIAAPSVRSTVVQALSSLAFPPPSSAGDAASAAAANAEGPQRYLGCGGGGGSGRIPSQPRPKTVLGPPSSPPSAAVAHAAGCSGSRRFGSRAAAAAAAPEPGCLAGIGGFGNCLRHPSCLFQSLSRIGGCNNSSLPFLLPVPPIGDRPTGERKGKRRRRRHVKLIM